MTIKALYPTINPTLNLDFANTKTLGPLVTFTRASSGTFVDSAGVLQTAATDVPRFDHDPTTGESLGLLVEEARTNLLLWSEEFNSAPWNSSGSTAPTVTANTAISPSGTLTADTITFAAADSRLQSDLIPVTAGVSYTFSVYVKAVGVSLNKCRLAFFDGAQQNSADFTVSNLTWTRISNTFVAANTASARVQIRNATDVLANSLFFWGAQLEAGGTPTSYIPTTTAAATRSADVASIGGSAFTSFYNQTEGTVFAEGNLSSSSYTGGVLWDIGAGGAFATTEYVGWSGTGWALGPAFAPLNVASFVATSLPSKTASAIKANDSVIAVNGLTGVVDTSCAIAASPTTLSIGKAGWTAGNFFNGTIRRLAFWPQRLPNSTLQALTQ